MWDLFKSKQDKLKRKVDKFIDLEKSLSKINVSIDELADEFSNNERQFKKAIKTEKNEFILSRVQSKYSEFKKSHLKEVSLIKKKKDSILKSMDKIFSEDEEFQNLLKAEKNYSYQKSILSNYRMGKVDLPTCDLLLKAKTKEKVKYADNLVFNEKGQILLLKRSEQDKSFPGLWVIPGGHVDIGEECEEASKRELYEEAGIEVNEVVKVGEYTDDKVSIKYFESHTTKEPVLQQEEIWSYKWVDIKDLSGYEMPLNMNKNIQDILFPYKRQIIKLKKALNDDLISKQKYTILLKGVLNKSIDWNKRIENLKKRCDPEGIEEYNDDPEGKFENLYKSLEDEFDKLQETRNLFISKGVGQEHIDKLNGFIIKAVKDISKLKKVKKLVNKDGKLFFQTFYTKDNTLEETKKELPTPEIFKLIKELSQGDKVSVITKKNKSIEGVVSNISYDKNSNSYWGCLQDETGKEHWFNTFTSKYLDIQESEKEESEFDEDGYKFLEDLGGSTGAKLMVDSFGNKVVKKTGKDKSHIKAEYEALKIYKSFGAYVPYIVNFDEEKGVLYTSYIEGLKKYSEEDLKKYKNYNSSGFERDIALDILLANWDAVGLEQDNILVHNGQWGSFNFYRVDVGGSLDKRAQGAEKEFTGEVKELETMLDPNINPNFAKFAEDSDIISGVKNLVSQYKDKEKYGYLDSIDHHYKEILDKRIEYLDKYVKGIEFAQNKEALEKINYDGKLFDIHKGYFGEDIYNFYEKINEDFKVSPEDMEFLKGSDPYFESEHSASQFLKNNASSEFKDFKKEYKELGVTNFELAAICQYTGSDYGSYNEALVDYTSAKGGNINFNKSILYENPIPKESKSEDFKGIKSSLDPYFNSILEAAKTINHHHNMGDVNYNQEKINKFKEVKEEIRGILKDMKENTSSYSQHEIDAMAFFSTKVSAINNAITKGSGEIPVIEKPTYFSEIQYNQQIQEIEPDKEKVQLNKLEQSLDGYKKTYFIKSKLLMNGLKKLEQSFNPQINLKGTFTRYINLNSETSEDFKKKHSEHADYVVHQRASSSAYAKEVMSGNNTKIIIHGAGVFVKPISQHSGEEEVLHKPFTLFKNSSHYKNDSGKDVYVLDKII